MLRYFCRDSLVSVRLQKSPFLYCDINVLSHARKHAKELCAISLALAHACFGRAHTRVSTYTQARICAFTYVRTHSRTNCHLYAHIHTYTHIQTRHANINHGCIFMHSHSCACVCARVHVFSCVGIGVGESGRACVYVDECACLFARACMFICLCVRLYARMRCICSSLCSASA